MKKQDGKTPLGWIITIVVVTLIIGVSVAMLFDGEDVRDSIKQMMNKNNTVQTENEAK